MLSRCSFSSLAARVVASSVKRKPFRFEQRVAIMADLQLDAVGQLAGFQRVGRGVPVDRVMSVDGGGAVVLDRAQPFGKPDRIEVLWVDIADCAIPAAGAIQVGARGMGSL